MNRDEKLKYIEKKTLERFIQKNEFICNEFIEPNILYKYMSINDNTLDALENEYVWCGFAKDLNDPFECLIKNDEEEKKEIYRYADEKTLKTLDITNDKYKATYGYLREVVANNIIDSFSNIYKKALITSFSEDNDNILMWSYYGDCHRGICVEYLFEDINSTSLSAIFPVVYDENIPKIRDYLKNNNIASIKQMTTKYIGWQHENEWRIINPDTDNIFKIEYDDDNIKGIKIILKAKRIFLGCNIKEKKEKEIREIANRKGIPVIKLSINSDKYKINIG